MAVDAGLSRILPRGAVYAEALASWSALGGPMGRVEAGARAGPLGFFAFGQIDRTGPSAGAGARVTW